jgi:predicted MFS family arabinose efflux permease
VVGALTLLGGLVTRPLGGRLMERWPLRTPLLVELSMLAAAAGTVLLLLDLPIAIRVAGAAALGLAAGIPFAYAFTRAQQIRRDAPALATGFVNSCATLTILVGAPLVGFTFSLPGDGAIGFAVVAALWAAAALPLRAGRTADAVAEPA